MHSEKQIVPQPYEWCYAKPLILGSSWELTLAEKKGALFFEVATPSSETLVVNRSHIGYRGALQFLERIYSASVGGK